eukprot:363096-Chlamydomonas_euryale.AAC.10
MVDAEAKDNDSSCSDGVDIDKDSRIVGVSGGDDRDGGLVTEGHMDHPRVHVSHAPARWPHGWLVTWTSHALPCATPLSIHTHP